MFGAAVAIFHPFLPQKYSAHRLAIRENLGLLTDVTFAQWKDEELDKVLEAPSQRQRDVLVVIGKWPGRMCHDGTMNLSLRDGALSSPLVSTPTRMSHEMNLI